MATNEMKCFGHYGKYEYVEGDCDTCNRKQGCFCASTKDEFESAARPLMKFLAENHHPHMQVIVDSTKAELVEGQTIFKTDEYLLD